jgi:hypothetical protein
VHERVPAGLRLGRAGARLEDELRLLLGRLGEGGLLGVLLVLRRLGVLVVEGALLVGFFLVLFLFLVFVFGPRGLGVVLLGGLVELLLRLGGGRPVGQRAGRVGLF